MPLPHSVAAPSLSQAKNNLLAPALALFQSNGLSSTNLLHSAIVELFDFIRFVSFRPPPPSHTREWHRRGQADIHPPFFSPFPPPTPSL